MKNKYIKLFENNSGIRSIKLPNDYNLEDYISYNSYIENGNGEKLKFIQNDKNIKDLISNIENSKILKSYDSIREFSSTNEEGTEIPYFMVFLPDDNYLEIYMLEDDYFLIHIYNDAILLLIDGEDSFFDFIRSVESYFNKETFKSYIKKKYNL